MVVDAKAETSFFAPDDLDFFYKSDNARKMLFYFQVSNNNREESHQKSEETDEDEAAIDNSVESWIGYWYLSLHIYLHIYHCQPEETDEDRAAHENLKKSKPSERSVVAMQAKYKVQVQVQAKYKVAENIFIFCVDLAKNNFWSDQKTTCNLWSVWPRPCDLTKNCLAAEHVQVEQEKAVHHRWHWCNSHGLLHVFSQVIQNLFFLVMNDFLG